MPATQEANRASQPLAVAAIPPIVNSVSTSGGKYGSGLGAGGPVYGTWGNDESATCGALWFAVELA